MDFESNEHSFKQANQIMASSGGLKGPEYLKSSLKRKLDIVVASAGLGLTSPIIMLAAAAVYLQDRRNPFFDSGFVNQATGKYSRFWKIRSMVPNAHLSEGQLIGNGQFYNGKHNGHDSRVTPVGRIIRKTSIDELPQFWNVLEGNYFVVGPRKYTPVEWEGLVIPQADPKLLGDFTYLLNNGMKFGITGLAAVLFRNSQSPNFINERLALNVLYGQQANFIADLRIIGLTPKVLFQGK